MNLIPFKENNLWGYLDDEGNIKISPKFLKAKGFKSDVALVCTTKHPNRKLHKNFNETIETYNGSYDELWGLINSNGVFIIEPNYKHLKVLSKHFASGIKYAGPGLEWNDYCQNKYFAIYSNSKKFNDLGRFNDIKIMPNGFCLLKTGRDPMGKDYCWVSYQIIDKNGVSIIDFNGLSTVSEFENEYIKVGQSKATEGVWGYETLIYDSKGELIYELPINIKDISKNLGGYYIYKENGKYFTLKLNENIKVSIINKAIDLNCDEMKSLVFVESQPSY